jgi:hypothetical protein
MTNHIASTSRWRLRAGVLGNLAGRALDHLRQAFSGFIVPELAAEAVRRSAQRPVALLPAPTQAVEPALVGLVEGFPQCGLRAAEPVAAVADVAESSLPVKVVPDDQPEPIPLQGAAERVRLPATAAQDPTIAPATAEPASVSSPDTLKRVRQARSKADVPVAVGQAKVEPVSGRPTVSRQPRKGGAGYFASAMDVPSSDLLVAEAVAASPAPTEAAAEGHIERPAPVDVVAPEVQPTPRARQGVTMRGEPPTKAPKKPMAGQAPEEPAAALSPGSEKRAGGARNKTSAPAAVPQPQAEPLCLRRTVSRKPRGATGAGPAASEGRLVNSSVVAR